MKKYITLLSIILIITSCDVEEGPYMSDIIITPIDTTTNTYLKKILIEDFTGHLCPNCPDAARELEAIHDIYGDQIIGMALHVTKSFARPYPAIQAPEFQYDFRTKWGDDWDAFYGISDAGLPRGMVNRIGFPDSHKLGKNEWSTAVANELAKDPDFEITINTTTSLITINTKVLNNINADYNLVVCLTESNIINWQKDGGNNIEDYEHNHVLRTVLADQELSNSINYIAGQEIQKTINYDLAALKQFNIDYSTNTAEMGNGNAGGWNANNMSVVAYIYNTTTKEIVQVQEAHLNN
jgi:hypothetical protein